MTRYQCAFYKILTKKLFCNIIVQYYCTILKTFLVICYSKEAIHYHLQSPIIWALHIVHWTLVIDLFILLFYQILLICSCLKKYVNDLVIYPHLQNLNLTFLVILWIFNLECHGETSLKIELVMSGIVFMKFRKSRNLYQENEKLNLHKS